MTKRRIGILTGGGDVPGLNSVIKTVTYRSSENDIEFSLQCPDYPRKRTSALRHRRSQKCQKLP
jgi:hypothetical protein